MSYIQGIYANDVRNRRQPVKQTVTKSKLKVFKLAPNGAVAKIYDAQYKTRETEKRVADSRRRTANEVEQINARQRKSFSLESNLESLRELLWLFTALLYSFPVQHCHATLGRVEASRNLCPLCNKPIFK